MVYSIREALEQDEKHDLEQKERGVAIQELRERLEAQAQDLGGLHRQMDGLSSSPESSGPPGGSEVPVVSGNPGAGVAQAVPVIVVQPGGGTVVKDSEDLDELRASVETLELALGFNAGLILSDHETLRDKLIEDDRGIFSFLEETPKTFEERQRRMPMPGDTAIMLARAALGDLDAGKIDLREYHRNLAFLKTTPDAELQALYAGKGETEEEEWEEDEDEE